MPDQKDPTPIVKNPIAPVAGVYTPDRFPYTQTDKKRLDNYTFFRKLFEGDHFGAYRIKIDSKEFGEQYARIRYLYVNYAGMITKIVADMLFGEPVKVKMSTKEGQAWVEDFIADNNFHTLLYESELTNSSLGDAVFKLRTGPRRAGEKQNQVILESCPPTLYFPIVDQFNVNGDPKQQDLAWRIKMGKNEYLRREIHIPGKIINKINVLEGDKIGVEVPQMLAQFGLEPEQETDINRSLVFHVPNWRTSDKWEGYSDYYDLDALFFAINNRLSMVDNVLDKHTDPILFVPPGVIDEKTGKVKKDGRVIEVKNDEDKKPEYIVWDASLENAFKEIEKMVEFVMMIGEVSPDVLGLGDGVSDSGRALKYKLIRTIAKVSRKKLYYHQKIREIIYVAQLLSKAGEAGVGADNKQFPGKPEMPELIWQDGLPVDESELIDIVTKQIDAGVTSQKDGIIAVHGIDEDAADKKLEEIRKESELNMPPAIDPNKNLLNPPKDMPPKNMPPKPNAK